MKILSSLQNLEVPPQSGQLLRPGERKTGAGGVEVHKDQARAKVVQFLVLSTFCSGICEHATCRRVPRASLEWGSGEDAA